GPGAVGGVADVADAARTHHAAHTRPVAEAFGLDLLEHTHAAQMSMGGRTDRVATELVARKPLFFQQENLYAVPGKVERASSAGRAGTHDAHVICSIRCHKNPSQYRNGIMRKRARAQ